ncbi:UDP-4-amino-4, 6-dideoxy-N-acetyl-beta-L-altrosamine transaminase [Pseudoalteromonas holothuriae]|uniref:UDP-4-amino-4, 6-dideoxy-N-acetyl-beta-L-altrosamine transaminase n=1 Tax=Pseudoalteromonas holothuriae TaxID=2963714 RepID=A0A9W4QX53_9GAMM|nr:MULTISPECIES: UDP-4-amino-4,6-dideoxy-N-acetyl-beta-L-altrosamine transaminase [unclassified Pseudoalteromonas]CAH9054295.1 UDP-4-amino-4, 6-dideoxy-N-acetyl-beta-L-altrosamine transaminase [Pseudoalteromonas sp. CIP111951]CAH9056969.1 UDP-4-amino-4, 6-dideoxy-N-acetyl-beta-L-altrosamine transaminase [Pseudoalteromonas sp. CIP111854]
MIPYGKQNISQADIDAVVNTLKSDFLTQGPQVPEFESAIASYCGANFAIAASNATACLHLACLALDVGVGDRIWTSPISFVASSNCALYCGGEVDFVDVEPESGLMCTVALRNKLEQAKKLNCLPKVVIPVHLTGQSCDMLQIAELAKHYNFKIIEDASHAIGATYLQASVGKCQYSDICVFSFHPVKIITTGEGGVATTNCKKLAKKLSHLRSHGITKDPTLINDKNQGSWYYEQMALGFNYRMTDLQATLGSSQLTRLDSFVSRRNQLASRYKQLLKGLPLSCVNIHTENYSSYHLFIILLDDSTKRRAVFEHLKENGIGVNVHYIPIYWQPYYQALGFEKGYCKSAEHFYESIITLPLYPELQTHEQDKVIEQLKACL